MAYKFLEHQADVGILGIGDTIEESFQESAKAMFEIMFNLKKIKIKKSIKIKVKADSQENLFIEFLNELLAQADLKEMAFSDFEVKIKNNNLECSAKGEKIDLKKHEIKTEVKAATYSGLKVEKKVKKFYSQCVLDV